MPDGTAVWFRHINNNYHWNKTYKPNWCSSEVYIVDNEYADIRKLSVDSDRPLEVNGDIVYIYDFIQKREDVKRLKLKPHSSSEIIREWMTRHKGQHWIMYHRLLTDKEAKREFNVCELEYRPTGRAWYSNTMEPVK